MKKITTILAVALAAIACNKTPEDVVPEIRLASEEAIVIPQEGTDGIAVQFNASVDWTAAVKNAPEGMAVVVTPKSGSAGDARVAIVADKNETNDNLAATLEIKAGTAVKELSITQLQKDAVSADFQKQYEVPVDGQVITFKVAHNIEFTAESDAEWIQKVESKAMSETEVSFNVAVNTGAAREGRIIVKAAGLPDAVATVMQEAWVLSLEVSEKSFEFTTEGGSKDFTVTSNTEYNVTVDENDWLTVDGEDGKYTVTVSENTDPKAREVNITIAPKDEAYAEYAKTITVSQEGTDKTTIWSVNMTEVAFPRVGSFIYVEPDNPVPTNVSMALFNGDVLVCAGDGTAPVILDKATGQKKGVLDLGNIKPGYITNDDAGNLVFCNRVYNYWTDNTSFTIYYMKSGDTEVTKLVSTADEEYYPSYLGSGLSVKGDITKKAAIAAPWEGAYGYGENMVLCWQVTDGKAGNYVKGTLTGFIGVSWMQGYWRQAPDNFPGYALIGDDLSDGAFLTVYDENKLYKVNADFTCTLLSDDPVLDGNSISNALYTYNTGENAYLVISGGLYFSEYGGSPVVCIFNQADKSLVAECNTHSFSTEPGAGLCSAAVRMENTAENGLVVYHINNACSVIEAIRVPVAQ